MRLVALLSLLLPGLAAAAVPLVLDGQAQAVIVTPREPADVVRYAAAELSEHVARATGVTLAQVSEEAVPAVPAGRVWLGPTAAARAAGLDPAGLPLEGCHLRTRGADLFVVGHDTAGPALDLQTAAGTLFGIYELLETAVGVRWLWPGELGTVVPRTTRLVIGDLDRQVAPRFVQRQIRSGLNLRGDERRSFTPAGLRRYAAAQAVFLRRHRLGQPLGLRYGHAFESWWARSGQDHPEWFQLVGGRRGPRSTGARTSMCVSSPSFHEAVLAEWRARREANGGAWTNLNGCENDIQGLCECAACQAWDGPQPAELPSRFGPRVVSDRYARFWLTIQQLAAREDPTATVLGYAYVNYAPPPSEAIRLNDHIWVGTVPDLFFPRQAADQEWVKQQWLGWAKTGCKLFLRPNYFLDGYCLPHVFAHQFAEEFQFEAAHGMMATDFDSLTGQWATQGPNLYLLCRLQTAPDRPVDDLLAEYYAGFGPAGAAVKAYFDHFERHTMTAILKQKSADTWFYPRYAAHAHELFPSAVLDAGDQLLAQAAAAARETEHRQRVGWLRLGLEHARLVCRVSELMSGQGATWSPVAAGRALADLTAFRRRTEGELISNYQYCAYIEQRSWSLPQGYTGEPLQPLVAAAAAPPDRALPTRGRHTFVALLQPGERLRARVACQRVGAGTAAAEWTVYAATQAAVANGSVAPGQAADLDLDPGPGVCVLAVNAGSNAAAVTLRNPHAALAQANLSLISTPARLYFWVPPGTLRAKVTCETMAPAETATCEVRDPSGKVVFSGDTTRQPRLVAELAFTAETWGKVWSVSYDRAASGVLEDVKLSLDDALPPYWAASPDQLLRPAP